MSMKENLFSKVQLQKPNSNLFDLTHDVKMSFNMGQLIPCCIYDCLPGDKFRISAESLIRFSPLVSPVMHRFDCRIEYFFIPNRLVWSNWEKFIVGESGYTPPYYVLTGSHATSFPLLDYLGLPSWAGAETLRVSAIPPAAYQLVCHEYYRDENLMNSSDYDFSLADGDNTSSMTNGVYLRQRCWEHDYFTSCLPFAQKGAAVDIPLGNVEINPLAATGGRFVGTDDHLPVNAGAVNTNAFGDVLAGTPNETVLYDPNNTLQVEATSINDLRRAFALQRWLEKNARGGTRYIEHILAHFGVKSSDARLQRPEYITGVKSPVVISEVLNTAGDTLPQGNMSGHGVSVVQGNYGSFFCEEHGYIIGLMSVCPKSAYQQGVARHWSRLADPTEYFFGDFQHIGEQEVKNKEIYVASDGDNEDTFGYIPRYSEYKFVNNRVAGEFKTTLDFWHEGRIFGSRPQLNSDFVQCIPDTRIFAVETGQLMYAHVLNKISAVRRMAKYGNPI